MIFWNRNKKNEAGESPAEPGPTDPRTAAPDAPETRSTAPQAAAPDAPKTGATDPRAVAADAPETGSTDAQAAAADAPKTGEASEKPGAGPATPIDATMTEAKVIEAIRTCYDPEIPVNIYELGLIYEVEVKDSGEVAVKMTLTSPMCPVAGTLPHEVEAKVAGVAGVKSAQVDLVWDPPWTPERMSEAAKLQLGML